MIRMKVHIMKKESKLNLNNVYKKCFYRKFEVLSHIKPDDFWVILDRRVLDLSALMKSMNKIPDIKNLSAREQLNMLGGTDITELFEKSPANKLEMFDLKSYSEYGKVNNLFWWNDPACIVGGITTQERHICVQNKTKGTQCHLTVCEEDSIYQIQAKFFAAYADSNAENMVWRKTSSTCCPKGHLFLDKTLNENGLLLNPKDEITFIWMFHRDHLNACPGFM